ncbi:hypothetical protein M9H77_13983 [Catharanthus roseus]|uniref:Uncharacterized protein n=1 Tax=Catharanthus roseus TaxID=4058 RepID=A0ACC0BLY6_CATRO|nr:hypothetical protein M9H77_13983 [Catharanthus roseus]
MDGSAKEESVDSLELRPRAQPIPLPLAFGTRGGQPILLITEAESEEVKKLGYITIFAAAATRGVITILR